MGFFSRVFRPATTPATNPPATNRVSPAPVADDDDYWNALSRWREPHLTTAEFATLLDVSPAAIRQYASRDERFPTGEVKFMRGTVWPEASVYPWIREFRAHLSDRIPRLFHSGEELPPATFIASETISLNDDQGRPTPWVIHLWEPADNRGMVAVAYGEHRSYESRTKAVELLGLLSDVSLVAVTTDELCHLPASGSGYAQQPEIWVAERHLPAQARGWFDLAALLRVNLPWWPDGLRRPADIAAWRPGARPQAIRPYAPGWYDETILATLVDGSDQDQAQDCREIIDVVNRHAEGRIYSPSHQPDVPGGTERPGLVLAALPYFAHPESPSPVAPWECAQLLALAGARRESRSAARKLLAPLGVLQQFINYVICTRPTDGPLAQEWIARLIPRDDPQSLGSVFIEDALRDRGRGDLPRTWLSDPKNPFCWIAETVDGDYYATVGSQIPATGTLSEFELSKHSQAAFLRANGTVWPMPVTGFGGYYTSGYRGHTPAELVSALSRLMEAADTDLANRPSTPPPVSGRLQSIVYLHEPPLRLHAEDLGDHQHTDAYPATDDT